MEIFKSGEEVGAGAAINVQLGWLPDRVEVYNATDGTILTVGFCRRWMIPFSSGGVFTTLVGHTIVGVTSKARAIVSKILLASGSWAGGDAAGFFVVEPEDLTGTFSGENVTNTANVGATDDATVTANVTHAYKVDTAAAAVTGNNAIAPYVGAASSAAKGFTIGSAVATAGKALRWSAWRNSQG